MSFKKQYFKPEVTLVDLDYSITLLMLSNPPPGGSPPPPTNDSKGNDTPFQSPFGDKPFG